MYILSISFQNAHWKRWLCIFKQHSFSGIKRVCDGDGGMCEDRATERVYFLKESAAKMFMIDLLSDHLGTSVDTTSIRFK